MTALQQALTSALSPLKPTKLVLALSGGLDSMVLLQLCAWWRQQHGTAVQVVHVHHGISQFADDWAEFCQQQAALRCLPCQVLRVQLPSDRNLEATAREARYQALSGFISEPGAVLLTAHHADDQLESLLLALKRGSGPAGLAGIACCQPFGAGHLVRPLLAFSRAELEVFASQHPLPFVTDDSNDNTRFDRNFLRSEVIPLLQQRWPSFRSNALRSQSHITQLWQWQQQQLEPKLALVAKAKQLNLTELALYQPTEQALLVRSWLAGFGLNPSSLWLHTFFTELVAAKADATPLLLLEHYQLRRFRSCVYLLLAPVQLPPQLQPWDGEILILPTQLGDLTLSSLSDGVAVNYDPNQPLLLSFAQYHWPFRPVGQAHRKPLKQWLKLWGIPPWQRSQLPVLLQHDEVIAVAGLVGNARPSNPTAWFNWQQGPGALALSPLPQA